MSSVEFARGVGFRFLLVVGVFLGMTCAPLARAQSADRVVGPVVAKERVAMRDHHPFWASRQNDLGAVPADLPLTHLTLILARSPETQRAFEDFLARQQDPASSDYQHWLTPTEVGDRFGVSANDIAAVSEWLRSQGLQVDSISNSRVRITFSGPAAAVGRAFAAEMHYFNVNGKQKISVATEPQVPAALAPVIKVIHGLYTIEDHPAHKSEVGYFSTARANPNLSLSNGMHFITPADFTTIYHLGPFPYSNIDGLGQAIAIIAQARVYEPDIRNFDSVAGWDQQLPRVIVPPNGVDPGPPASSGGVPEDQAEATLDVTRAGSVAPGANMLLVVSDPSGGGIETAAQYVVDTTPVPAQVMSISYGACESSAGPAGVTFWDELFSQAAAEGMSSFVASGDSGVAGCDDQFQTPPANQTASPNYICSSSYATCVGGTEFADVTYPALYWTYNDDTNLESALRYIPEGGWNEPTNSTGGFQAAASGGGVSAFIPTPSWQSGPGVPAARVGRYTPDVAFSASAHDGYFACLAAANAGCEVQNDGSFYFVSLYGTSAAAPDMAGIAALLNQEEGIPQGNLNPGLYQLAATTNNVFHDVTVASSGVANCDLSTPSMCNNSTPSPTGLTGGLVGYVIGPGYDQVTGLGSLDVTNLLAAWPPLGLTAVTATGLNSDAAQVEGAITFGSYITFYANVRSTGSILPTGTVAFVEGATQLATVPLNAQGVARFATSSLALGMHTITAVYSGDARHWGSTSAAVTVSVNSYSLPIPAITALSPSSAVLGTDLSELIVYGSNFVGSANIVWNSVGVGTEFVSSSELHMTSGVSVVTPGTYWVQVQNSLGDLSNPVPFEVVTPALRFVPLAPCRIVDTRADPFEGPIFADTSSYFLVPDSACGVPATAAAYSLNVTVVPRGPLGYLTIWPTSQPQPLASTLNSYDGRIKANAAIVPTVSGGSISVYATDTTDLVLDIDGYFVPASDTSALAFFPVPPCRVADTRNPSGALGGPSLAAGETRSLPVLSSSCNIPSTAQAYSLNFTAVPHGPLGYLTTWPTGTAQPLVSTLNALTGAVTANAAIVPAGTNGEISVYVKDASDVVVDINGYFAPSTSDTDLSFFPMTPCRTLDTRQTTGSFFGRPPLVQDMTAGFCGVPASAQAVVLNATAVPMQSFLGYLTLWPDGQTQPLVSTLNAYDGQVTSNMAIVPTSSSGAIDAFATDPTQLILDTSGYFASGTLPAPATNQPTEAVTNFDKTAGK